MRSRHATWKPVPYTGLHKRQPRRAVVLHRNGIARATSLQGYFTGNAHGDHGAENVHVGAHLQVRLDGTVEEYVDLDLVIYHAYGASEWSIGIETEDDKDPSKPWTPAQVKTIIALCRELKVPGRLLKQTPSDGVGWHEQYPAWNSSAHSCPGPVREKQIREEILPALQGRKVRHRIHARIAASSVSSSPLRSGPESTCTATPPRSPSPSAPSTTPSSGSRRSTCPRRSAGCSALPRPRSTSGR
jgi:hypothetical protein